MALTYQPFAENPVLDQIESRPEVNVADGERLISALCGALLAIIGLSRGSLGGKFLAVLGAALVYRGVSGRCHTYDSLGIDTVRHPRELPKAEPS